MAGLSSFEYHSNTAEKRDSLKYHYTQTRSDILAT